MSDEAKPSVDHASARKEPSQKPIPSKKLGLRMALIGIAAIVVFFVIILRAYHAWHTVSTDDACVDSYVTYVAPRVGGPVAQVLADDNNRVKEGDVLVELDPDSYRVQVAIKQHGPLLGSGISFLNYQRWRVNYEGNL